MTDTTNRITAKTDLKKLPPEFYDGQWDLHSTQINLDWATKSIKLN